MLRSWTLFTGHQWLDKVISTYIKKVANNTGKFYTSPTIPNKGVTLTISKGVKYYAKKASSESYTASIPYWILGYYTLYTPFNPRKVHILKLLLNTWKLCSLVDMSQLSIFNPHILRCGIIIVHDERLWHGTEDYWVSNNQIQSDLGCPWKSWYLFSYLKFFGNYSTITAYYLKIDLYLVFLTLNKVMISPPYKYKIKVMFCQWVSQTCINTIYLHDLWERVTIFTQRMLPLTLL